MTDNGFLDKQLTILLAYFGEEAILKGLASKIGLDEDVLLHQIGERKRALPPKRSPRKNFAETTLDRLASAHPEKAELLRTLFNRYENRLFLGTTRELQRFFDTQTGKPTKTRSRSEALPKLLTLLSGMDVKDLMRLCAIEERGSESVLSQISDELLRRDR